MCRGNRTTQTAVPIKVESLAYYSGELNGQEYVDLGLTSGLKWATKNIGADKPTDFGDCYDFGGTEPNVRSKIPIIEKNASLEYDAAHIYWGKGWRLPTNMEFQELKDECKWVWVKVSGVYGMQITGPNGNSIFLPAAFEYKGEYWSSTMSNGSALKLGFVYDSFSIWPVARAKCGYISVRPVTE